MHNEDPVNKGAAGENPASEQPVQADNPLSQQAHNISDRVRHTGIIVWSSFLTAGAGSMFFFAMFDPTTLSAITTWSIVFSRMTGYTVGFFLFWILTAATSLLTFYLLKPPQQ